MKAKFLLTLLFLIIYFADQITKIYVVKIIPLYGYIRIFNFLNISHIENTGVAFGFLSDLKNIPIQKILIIIIFLQLFY